MHRRSTSTGTRAARVLMAFGLLLLALSPIAPGTSAAAGAEEAAGGPPPPGDWSEVQAAPQPSSTGTTQGSAVAMGVDPNGDALAAVSSGGGSVFVYGQNAGGLDEWGLLATLTKDDASGEGSSTWGNALALEGGYLLVGDQQYDKKLTNLDNPEGRADLFRMGATGAEWTYLQELEVGDHKHNNFGAAVDIANDCAASMAGGGPCWAVVGAPGADFDSYGASDEYVAIYDLSTAATSSSALGWTAKWQNQVFKALIGADPDLGEAVAIDGNWAFFGAPGESAFCGAYYDTSGTTPEWHQQSCFVPPFLVTDTVEYEHDTFASTLDYSAATNQLLVGVPDNSYWSCPVYQCGDDSSKTTTHLPGEVQVFQPVWTSACGDPSVEECLLNSNLSPTASLTPGPSSPQTEGTYFGSAVSVDGSGTVAVVGMSEAKASPSAPGSAFVYQLDPGDGAAGWQLDGEIPPTIDDADGGEYGAATAITDGVAGDEVALAVGAPEQPPVGSTYFFAPVGAATMGLSMGPVGPSQISDGDTITFEVVLANETGVGIPASAAETLSLQTGFTGLDGASAGVDLARSSIEPTAGYGSPGDGPAGYWECAVLGCTTVVDADYPAGATTTFTVTFAPTDATPGRFTAFGAVRWRNPTPGGFTSATAPFEVVPPATAAIEVGEPSPALATYGQPITFPVTFTNTGSIPAAAPTVVASATAAGPGDPPPPAVALATDDPTWTCTGATCDAPLLAPGATATFTATATGAATSEHGAYDVTTAVTATWGNGDPGTASGSATGSVGDIVTLTLLDQQPAGTVADGSVVTWTWEAANVGDVDVLPVGLTVVVDVEDVTDTTLAPPSGWTCERVDGFDVCTSDERLRPGDTATFSFTATIRTNDDEVTVDPVLDVVTPAFDAGLIRIDDPLTVAVEQDPGATATVAIASQSPGVNQYGAPLTFEITATNTGDEPLTDPEVTNAVTADGTGVDLRGVALTTTEPGWTCTTSGDGSSCSADSLAAGATATFTATAAATAAPQPDLTVTSAAGLTWSNGTGGPGSATATASATVGQAATLTLAQDPPGPVQAGSAATWTWTVTNVSNADLEVGLFEVLLDPTAVVGASVDAPGTWSCETPASSPGGPFLCAAIGRLKSGDTATFTLGGTVETTAPTIDVLGVFRYATATSPAVDVRAGAQVAVVQPASVVLSAAMGAASPPPVPGGRVVVDVTATNGGPATAAQVTYRFDEPVGTSLASVTTPDGTAVPVGDLTTTAAPPPARWSCTRAGGSVSCTGPDLAPGTSHRFVVHATVHPSTAPGTTLRFDSHVSTATPNADPSTTSASLRMTVVAPAPSPAGTRSGSDTLPATGASSVAPLVGLAVALLLGGAATAGVGARARGRSLSGTTRPLGGSA